MIGLNEMGVVRELGRENRDSLRKGAAFILFQIPGGKINFLQKGINSLIVREEVLVKIVWIPEAEDISKVEDDCFRKASMACSLGKKPL